MVKEKIKRSNEVIRKSQDKQKRKYNITKFKGFIKAKVILRWKFIAVNT